MLCRKIIVVCCENRTKQEYTKLTRDSVGWSLCLMVQVECRVQWLSAINGYTTVFYYQRFNQFPLFTNRSIEGNSRPVRIRESDRIL
jgi:hypothetical protein